MLDTDPEFDKHKMDSLEKQKKGDGHWKPELASDSEENVKADRGPSGPEHIQELQAQAKKDAEAAKRGGS